MHKIVISDTSILILFQKIGQLNLLNQLYGEVMITQEVVEEYGDTLPKWIKVENVSDKKYQEFLETQVDIGEARAHLLLQKKQKILSYY